MQACAANLKTLKILYKHSFHQKTSTYIECVKSKQMYWWRNNLHCRFTRKHFPRVSGPWRNPKVQRAAKKITFLITSAIAVAFHLARWDLNLRQIIALLVSNVVCHFLKREWCLMSFNAEIKELTAQDLIICLSEGKRLEICVWHIFMTFLHHKAPHTQTFQMLDLSPFEFAQIFDVLKDFVNTL